MANPYGHFDLDRHEYVIHTHLTPRAWINYLGGTADLDAFVSNRAGGTSWYKQPHTGRITRYQFMSQPEDNPGFFLYLKDGTALWTPSCMPTRTPLDQYECRHGLYYTAFDSEKNGLRAQVKFMIPRNDSVLLWDITFTNNTDRERVFTAYPYQDFCMRDVQKEVLYYHFSGNQMTAWFDRERKALRTDYFAFEATQKGYTLFNASKPFSSYDMEREAFLGRCGCEADPEALHGDGVLSGSEVTGAGFPICGAFRLDFKLAPGASERVIVKMAVHPDLDKADELLKKYDDFAAVDAAAEDFAAWWKERLSRCQVHTPDPELNEMLNIWLPKNVKTTMRCGRSLSQKHTGCYTSFQFRDTMQDTMSGAFLFPEETRDKIAKLVHSIRADGTITPRIDPTAFTCPDPDHFRCDSIVWGIYTVARYVCETGDLTILDEPTKDFEGNPSTVLGLLLRAMHFTGDNLGTHGLPKLFDCDWNDCLVVISAVLDDGESVMVAEQYIVAARELIGLLDDRYAAEKEYLRGRIAHFTKVLDSDEVWDGEWYRRLLFPNAHMGGRDNDEGTIFLNSQAWAAIAGTLSPAHVKKALDSVYEKLNTRYGIRLCTPGFTKLFDGSRFCANLHGAGENAGLFYHANNWAIIAEAMQGNADRAWEYFRHFMPNCRAADNEEVFQREPYAFASWCYGPQNARFGTAALSHLTGGASWAYRTAIEFLLGIKAEKEGMRIVPCIPAEWDGYEVTRKVGDITYQITVKNPAHKSGPDVDLQAEGAQVEGTLVRKPATPGTVKILATIR